MMIEYIQRKVTADRVELIAKKELIVSEELTRFSNDRVQLPDVSLESCRMGLC
jgi:hypothetical protein